MTSPSDAVVRPIAARSAGKQSRGWACGASLSSEARFVRGRTPHSDGEAVIASLFIEALAAAEKAARPISASRSRHRSGAPRA
jgi:hypothetical protein